MAYDPFSNETVQEMRELMSTPSSLPSGDIPQGADLERLLSFAPQGFRVVTLAALNDEFFPYSETTPGYNN